MKKKVLVVVGVLILAILMGILFTVWHFTKSGGGDIASGTYRVQYVENDPNASLYPDAYIIVENGTLQLVNIDLNQLYREKEISIYNEMVDSFSDSQSVAISEEELEVYSNLNAMFVTKPYELANAKVVKQGSNIYDYQCRSYLSFGLCYTYDSWDKSISIIYDDDSFKFVKE